MDLDSTSKRPDARRLWYWTAVGTAVAAGLIGLTILTLLTVQFARGGPRVVLDSSALTALKLQLQDYPQDEALKGSIRSIDQDLRRRFLLQEKLLQTGRWILFGTLIVCLASIRMAAQFGAKPPTPGQAPVDASAVLRSADIAQQAILLLGLGLAAGGLYAVLALERPQPAAPAQMAAEPAGPAFPSDDEMRRNWPRFRGPDGLGNAVYTNAPLAWDGKTGTGVIWKTAIPLPGHSSPVVWNDRVFVTGADKDRRAVFCYDLKSGALVWQQAVGASGAQPAAPEVLADTGYAASTPATDGHRVYAVFANGNVTAFDFEGKPVWRRGLGVPESQYGYASSLQTYKNTLLMLWDQASAEDNKSRLLALNVATGESVWETPRPVPNSWATPIVVKTGVGEQLLTAANPWVMAYTPATGAELWRAGCLNGDVAPSPVYANGTTYVVNANAVLAAIRVDGQGDVTATHIAWKADGDMPDIVSPLYAGGLLFTLTTPGMLTCYDAGTGAKVWEKEMGIAFQASPTLVGNRIYFLSEEGVTVIVEADRAYKEIGRAELGEPCRATPAFLDGRIVIRGTRNLWCIGAR